MNFDNLNTFINHLHVKSDRSLTLEKLLERAYDIRKFEIELYWKRATYFWGFLIASFTAYFIVSDNTKFQDDTYQLIVICFGLLFSLSWYLVNRGSAYWQSNWERMIEAIEEKLKIDFYVSDLLIDEKKFLNPIAPYRFTVGKINIIVSLYVYISWILLLCLYLESNLNFSRSFDLKKMVFILTTVLFSYILLFKAEFHDKRRYIFFKRDFKYGIDS